MTEASNHYNQEAGMASSPGLSGQVSSPILPLVELGADHIDSGSDTTSLDPALTEGEIDDEDDLFNPNIVTEYDVVESNIEATDSSTQVQTGRCMKNIDDNHNAVEHNPLQNAPLENIAVGNTYFEDTSREVASSQRICNTELVGDSEGHPRQHSSLYDQTPQYPLCMPIRNSAATTHFTSHTESLRHQDLHQDFHMPKTNTSTSVAFPPFLYQSSPAPSSSREASQLDYLEGNSQQLGDSYNPPHPCATVSLAPPFLHVPQPRTAMHPLVLRLNSFESPQISAPSPSMTHIHPASQVQSTFYYRQPTEPGPEGLNQLSHKFASVNYGNQIRPDTQQSLEYQHTEMDSETNNSQYEDASQTSGFPRSNIKYGAETESQLFVTDEEGGFDDDNTNVDEYHPYHHRRELSRQSRADRTKVVAHGDDHRINDAPRVGQYLTNKGWVIGTPYHNRQHSNEDRVNDAPRQNPHHGFQIPATANEHLPSRWSGVSINPAPTNRSPEYADGQHVPDASLQKRGQQRISKNRVPKRASGATDPENVEIVELYENGGKSYAEIAKILNEKRIAKARDPSLTASAVAARHIRTGPILFQAAGKVWVTPSKRTGSRTAGVSSLWNPTLDQKLLVIKREVESTMWDQVTDHFNKETGKNMTRQQITTRWNCL